MNTIEVYLRDILKSIHRIMNYTRTGKADFFDDEKTQDAVARNFEIIGEVVKRIPIEVLNQQPTIPWRSVASFRNALIHDYNEIELDEVWRTIEQDLPNLKVAVEQLLAAFPPQEE